MRRALVQANDSCVNKARVLSLVVLRCKQQEVTGLVPLLVSLGLVTLMSGGLGFSLGLIKSFGAMGEVVPESRWIWMIGTSEALNNVALALILSLVGGLAASVGALRIARSEPEAQVS